MSCVAGTAAAVASLGRHIAGKTGTTNEYRSAWFVGYTPSMVVGVFVGFDDNRSLGQGETGAQAAVPIFIDFMRNALATAPQEDFRAPKNAKLVSIHGHVEAFQPGTEPKPEPVVLAPSETGPQVVAAPTVAASVAAHPLMTGDVVVAPVRPIAAKSEPARSAPTAPKSPPPARPAAAKSGPN